MASLAEKRMPDVKEEPASIRPLAIRAEAI